jgi:hypothetical protein
VQPPRKAIINARARAASEALQDFAQPVDRNASISAQSAGALSQRDVHAGYIESRLPRPCFKLPALSSPSRS